MDKSHFKDYKEHYVIKCQNIGRHTKGSATIINVYTLIGTSDVILMYPVAYPNVPVVLEIPTEEIVSDKKVKRLSNMEKFRQKYGDKY